MGAAVARCADCRCPGGRRAAFACAETAAAEPYTVPSTSRSASALVSRPRRTASSSRALPAASSASTRLAASPGLRGGSQPSSCSHRAPACRREGLECRPQPPPPASLQPPRAACGWPGRAAASSPALASASASASARRRSIIAYHSADPTNPPSPCPAAQLASPAPLAGREPAPQESPIRPPPPARVLGPPFAGCCPPGPPLPGPLQSPLAASPCHPPCSGRCRRWCCLESLSSAAAGHPLRACASVSSASPAPAAAGPCHQPNPSAPPVWWPSSPARASGSLGISARTAGPSRRSLASGWAPAELCLALERARNSAAAASASAPVGWLGEFRPPAPALATGPATCDEVGRWPSTWSPSKPGASSELAPPLSDALCCDCAEPPPSASDASLAAAAIISESR